MLYLGVIFDSAGLKDTKVVRLEARSDIRTVSRQHCNLLSLSLDPAGGMLQAASKELISFFSESKR